MLPGTSIICAFICCYIHLQEHTTQLDIIYSLFIHFNCTLKTLKYVLFFILNQKLNMYLNTLIYISKWRRSKQLADYAQTSLFIKIGHTCTQISITITLKIVNSDTILAALMTHDTMTSHCIEDHQAAECQSTVVTRRK